MKYTQLRSIIILTLFGVMSFSLNAQNKKNTKADNKKISVTNMIDSQHYVFVAQTVSPLRSGFQNLSSYYYVEIFKDTMISNLPYYGRAYVVAYNSSQPVLDFTSPAISYQVTPYKKNGWSILVKPKDKPEIQQYSFTIFNNGSANLSVTSTSRDAISFNGYITSPEKRKK